MIIKLSQGDIGFPAEQLLLNYLSPAALRLKIPGKVFAFSKLSFLSTSFADMLTLKSVMPQWQTLQHLPAAR